MNPTIRKYLSDLGRKGGSVSSPAKTAAAKLNCLKPPRPGRKVGRPRKYVPGVCVVCDFNEGMRILNGRDIPDREKMKHAEPCPRVKAPPADTARAKGNQTAPEKSS